MEKLEIHTLICKRDIDWFLKTIKLFSHYTEKKFEIVIHEDGSFEPSDFSFLYGVLNNLTIIERKKADEEIKEFLKDYEYCTHFRFAEHHTIFKIKLFDPFYFTKSNNVMYMDADILFCKRPSFILGCVDNQTGFYLKDSWSSYCVPFRDEDNNNLVDRYINAGLNYYPTKNHYSLKHIDDCLKIMYERGSRGATHPFLEQSCVAYMITQLKKEGIIFNELPHPQYCVPTLNGFIPEHGLTALHLNSCPAVGHSKNEHYDYELKKILNV